MIITKSPIKFALVAITTMAISQASLAIPLVYQCTLTDHNSTGSKQFNFLFNPSNKLTRFSSEKSEVQLYLNPERTLTISIRPLQSKAQYSSVTGFNLPKRVRATHASGDDSAFAATIDCSL